MSSSVTIDTVCGTSKTGTGVLRALTWSEYKTLPLTIISSTSASLSWAFITNDDNKRTPIKNSGAISSKNL